MIGSDLQLEPGPEPGKEPESKTDIDGTKLETELENKTRDVQSKRNIKSLHKQIKQLELELREDEKENEREHKGLFGFLKSPGSIRSHKSYEHDFDDIVYNDDSASEEELEEEDEDGNIIHKWSRSKKHRFQKCLWKLKYNRIIAQFYLDNLRKREDKLSWWIMIISTVTSGLTIANNVEEEPFDYFDILINSSLTVSSMVTS